MKSLFDPGRQPVVIENREDATAYEWLDWIISEHPYVSADGQAVLIDGSLIIRLVDGLTARNETLLWSQQALVAGDRSVADLGPCSTLLYRVDPDGTRRPFPAPVPQPMALEDGRCLWSGPALVQLLEEVREAVAA